MGRPGHPGPLRNGWHKCCDRGLSPSPLADGRHTVLGSVIAFYRVIVSYFMQLSTSFQISWETAEKTLSFSLANGRVIVYNAFCTCRCDGIGRRSGLKIHRWRQRTGSSPVTGTIKAKQYRCRRPEAYGINCFRAFCPRKFTDDSIDANHCFPLTGGTRTPICSEVGKIKTMWRPF